MRQHKGTFALYVTLRLIVLACAAGALVFGNYEGFFLCLLTLALLFVPLFIEVSFKITIPETLEVVVALFIFAAEILGELFHFYTLFPFGTRCCTRSTAFWRPPSGLRSSPF